jgi:pimeloyl-CoA synthetase
VHFKVQTLAPQPTFMNNLKIQIQNIEDQIQYERANGNNIIKIQELLRKWAKLMLVKEGVKNEL